jgi:hypothetical protein
MSSPRVTRQGCDTSSPRVIMARRGWYSWNDSSLRVVRGDMFGPLLELSGRVLRGRGMIGPPLE